MGLLQISLIVIVACVVTLSGTYAKYRCRGQRCGCVFKDTEKIDDKDLICEPLRTQEFENFYNQLGWAFRRNWIAYIFLRTLNEPQEDDLNNLEVGRPICKSEIKNILGMWKDNGNTLCWVLGPDIYKAECCGEQCCGPNTRCEPSVYVRRKYLVYCNDYYHDGPAPRIDELSEADSVEFDQPTLETLSVDEIDNGDDDITKRSTLLRRGYFVFRHDPFPLTCSCRTCGM